MRTRWDIFCRVVDNFGDIGVTWRLARQLVAEQDMAVCLWVDDLNALCPLCPEADANLDQQSLSGVTVKQWPTQWPGAEAADVVIEAFACDLPAAYIAAMAERERPSLWLNLEYLSAEDWVEGCHGLPSLQAKGLHKFFFFPGFSAQTGGLLREADLLDRRRAFQSSPTARVQFLQGLGVEIAPTERLMSLFGYENSALPSWLDCLASDTEATLLLVPAGRLDAELQQWLRIADWPVGARAVRGQLTVQKIPFVSQLDYDRLLWSCDLNLVRGEDSFIRAQWAGRPLLWHIYPQQEQAHLIKLEAFLQHYCATLSPAAEQAVQAQWQAWNRGEPMTKSWLAVQAVWPELTDHAEKWCQRLAKQQNMSQALVQFYLNWL